MAEPTFEGIPTELRIAILLRISELNSFYNLILASPAYYQTYLCAQTSILRSLIFWQYRHVHITEAVAAISTEGLPAHDERNVDIVEDLLNQRRINLNLTNESLLLKLQPTPAEDYIELFQLYREFHYVLQLFCRTAPCPPWMESNKWQNEVLPLQLSDVEKARVLRALYRLQTYCNVYGPNVQYDPNPPKRKKPVMSRDTDKQPMTRRWRIVDYPEMWRTLFSTMPPWELDELICIWKWARTPYVGIFAEIADDVSEHGPRCKGVNPGLLPHETFELYPDGE